MTVREFKIEIIKQEIDLVNQKINHFDNLRHGTKQMAITLWLAAMGVGLTAKIEAVILLAAFVPLPFWFFEAIYHAYQEGFASRFWAIRNFIRTGQFMSPDGIKVDLTENSDSIDFGAFPVPDYYGNLTLAPEAHKKRTNVLRNFLKIKMVLFYLPLCVAALLLVLVI